MNLAATAGLLAVTASAEIIGGYFPYLWLRHGKSPWLLLPGAASLAMFARLLSMPPAAAGRVYTAYGGVCVSVAICRLWAVDGVEPRRSDLLGVAVCLLGMAITAAPESKP